MAKTHFRVIYNGPAVDDGEMDVRQLAPALLAIGKLIDSPSDRIALGKAGRVTVIERFNRDRLGRELVLIYEKADCDLG